MLTQNLPDPSQDVDVVRPVLVVDDSRAHCKLLARTLSKWGYVTIEAYSGEQALEICKATSIDVVISDWMMPGMSGIEFCREFRKLTAERPAYFILLTAQTEREVLAEGLESGADDFLSKPFSTVELRARLRAGERIVDAQRTLEDKLTELSDAYDAIDRDLIEARKFQEGLVPDRHLEIGGFDISMLFRPSGHIGGDLVGWFRVDETTVGVYSVDVSGHGVSSALMTARVASYLSDAAPDRNIALKKVEGRYQMRPLTAVCAKLNGLLQSDNESDQYLTMAICKIDLDSGDVDICQAGHPYPAVQRADGSVEFIELFGTPIGLIEDAEFSTSQFTLEKGDRLMLYSDGLTECANQNGDLLDEAGLEKILMQHKDVHGLRLVESVVSDLIDYGGSSDFDDDLSAALVRRR